MERKRLKHYKARHKTTKVYGLFLYYSMKQAQFFNPSFVEWKEVPSEVYKKSIDEKTLIS